MVSNELRGFGEDKEESGYRTVWIQSLPGYVDEQYLSQQLSDHGIIRYKVNDRMSGHRGDKYAFLEFESRESAARFMELYNGNSLPGIQGAVKLDYALQNNKGGRGTGREDDRDYHSIFVGELSDDVTEETLMAIFAQYFQSTRSAKVVRSPGTGASRGFGFVRFADEADKERALASMAGFLIGNRPIRVRSATGKNEPPPFEARRYDSGSADADANHSTLFVGNLSSMVTEDMLKNVFSPYGAIAYVRIPAGKGCGFVQMVHRAHAQSALESAHGQILGGQPIRVAWGKSTQSLGSASYSQPAAYDSYSAYPTAQAIDPNAYYQPSMYTYEQVEGQEVGTSAANTEYLLRNQISILGPLPHAQPA